MDCLTDYIGVRGCGATEPDSGIYVNSLPSINLRQLQGIADSEQDNFLGVWADIQTRAQSKLLLDVSTRMRKRYKLNSFIESFSLSIKTDGSTFPAAVEERGFAYDTQNFSGQIIKSDFYIINVEYMRLYLSAATVNPVVVKIQDIDTDEILFTQSIAPAAQVVGWNLLKVNKSYLNQRLKFVYDATEVASISTNQNDLINKGCGCVNYQCGGKLEGIKGNATSYDSYGLVAKINLACTYEPIICKNKELFAGPFLYLLGSETMIERIYTERMNEFTTVGADEAKELNNYFLGEYDNGLDNLIAGINIDLNDCCIQCNSSIRVVEQTP